MCGAVRGYRDRDFLQLLAGTLVEVRALMQSRIVSVWWIKCKLHLVVVMVGVAVAVHVCGYVSVVL